MSAELAGQLGAVLRRVLGFLDQFALGGLVEARLRHFEISRDDGQEIVELMREPPVSWRIASIFCDCRSSSSIFCRLLRSRMKPVKMRLPLVRASPTASSMGKVAPSLLSLCRPRRSCVDQDFSSPFRRALASAANFFSSASKS
jgi:hypothetical protein